MNEQVRLLQILHVAFVMSQLIFCAVVFYLINNAQMEAIITDTGLVEKIKTILVGTLTGVIVGGFGLFKRSVRSINNQRVSIDKKLERYKKAAIIRFAMIEFSSLLFIVFALLSADAKNLVYAAVIILVLIFTRQINASLAKKLRVTEEEMK